MQFPVKAVFLGSYAWSARLLEALFADDGIDIPLVLTVPEKAGKDAFVNPVRELCLERGLDDILMSPARLDYTSVLSVVQSSGAHCALSVAYPKRIAQAFLDAFPYGGWNVHPSLLPRWRGPDPVRRAMLAGDEAIGCTLHQLVYEFDAGDILWQASTHYAERDTMPEVLERLASLAVETIPGALAGLVQGITTATPQVGEACYAAPIEKKDRWITREMSFREANRRIAALTPHRMALWKNEGDVYELRATLGRKRTHGSLPVTLSDGVFYAPVFHKAP